MTTPCEIAVSLVVPIIRLPSHLPKCDKAMQRHSCRFFLTHTLSLTIQQSPNKTGHAHEARLVSLAKPSHGRFDYVINSIYLPPFSISSPFYFKLQARI